MPETRGRPRKQSSNIKLEIDVQYVANKTNKFDQNVAYFKIIDSNVKQKLKPFYSALKEGMGSPLWKTDTDLILTVKDKHISMINLMTIGKCYSINLEFNHYESEVDSGVKTGYWSKVIDVKLKENPEFNPDVEIDENN
jgi:hypothetical protein